MGIIALASGASCWKGLEYYKDNKVVELSQINSSEFNSKVLGADLYNVHLNIAHARKSTCDCPLAFGKRIICKHIVATFFAAFPEEANNFEKEQERLQGEIEDYQQKLHNKVNKYIASMKKEELVNELQSLLDYGPEWMYNSFVRDHRIGYDE